MKTTYEFIFAASYSVCVDKKIYRYSEELSKKSLYDAPLIPENSTITKSEIIKYIQENGIPPQTKTSGCEEADELFLSAALLEFHGYFEQAQKTRKHAYYLLIQNQVQVEKLSNIEQIIKNTQQKVASSKPRNKNHESVISIAKATWEKYPGASMGKLCEKLRTHFNGGVSLDTLERWIKAAKIRPPKPEKYTSFSLVIPPSA
ncbi:hypothetical protein QMS86_16365 [Cronobacter dublinensis]|uniref:hypothetical protein n=1 Tax=Cronobacter dublinensis TaxID=413497 RepID=UPI003AE45F65